MFVYIVLSVIFFIFGTIFAFNKGNFLLAGLNTSDNSDKADTKKINHIWSISCYLICIVSFIGIFVNESFYMVGIVFPLLIIVLVLSIYLSNKY